MKKLILAIITIYQVIFSPILKVLLGTKRMCRYEQTCSAYAKEIIEKEGVLRGVVKAMLRVARCQPFAKTV